MSASRLGTPVELPWWVFALGLPPAAILVLGTVLGAPVWAHVLAVVASLALLFALAAVATRVSSRNMQSVWVSAAYAVWFFAAVVWVVAVATPACVCAD